MGLFDKLKDATNKASEMASDISRSAKAEYERAKTENIQRKAEKDAYNAEMEERATRASDILMEQIVGRKSLDSVSIFEQISDSELLRFTKEFYEKMVLPGSKASLSCILMYPYIIEKNLKDIKQIMPENIDSELLMLYVKDSENQEFLLSNQAFYFRVRYSEDRKFWCTGKIGIGFICNFNVDSTEGESRFKVNGIPIAVIKIRNTYLQDFMALNEYCRAILDKDFDISSEEINRLIQQKVGSKIYQHIKKYMVYDDELIMYYASGSDSLTASDYIACTTRQIIIVDREAFGVTSNVRQFYYEDITSMATVQNSGSSDLLGFLIDTAITAVFKLCDLVITVAGSANRINNLYTVEAERVVAIYHEYRKEAKKGIEPVQNIIQQNEPDAMEQLMKLGKLKEAGIITEEEFKQKKAILLDKI